MLCHQLYYPSISRLKGFNSLIIIAILSITIMCSLCNGDLHFVAPEIDESPNSFVERLIEQSEVIVFSKSYCPWCAKTKSLFKGLTSDEPSSPSSEEEQQLFPDIAVSVVELDLTEHGSSIQNALMERTGQRTVPNVFIAGHHIGGNDATQALAGSGKLNEMLADIMSSKEL